MIKSGKFALVSVSKDLIENNEGEEILCVNQAGAENLFEERYLRGNSVESIFELQFAKDITNPLYSYFTDASRRSMIPNDEHIVSDIFISTEKEGMGAVYIDARKSISTKGGYMWKWAGAS